MRCKHCGVEIILDEEDGYWESISNPDPLFGGIHWTILCEEYNPKLTNNIHEPEEKENLFDRLYLILKDDDRN